MSGIDDCLKSVKRLTRDRGEVMRAADDKIEKIRAHHAEAEIALRGTGWLRKVHPHDAPEWAMDAHDDRATLLAEVEELKRRNTHLVRHNEWYLETLTEASLGRTEILAVIGTSLCVRFPKTFIDASMTEEDRRIIEKVMRQTSHADSDRERTEASREAERTLWFSRICAMRRAGIMVEEAKP